MAYKDVSDDAINSIAKFINQKSNKNYSIPVVGDENNPEVPHIFEIIPFNEIDKTSSKFYAIDGSYNSQEFYNGMCIAVYAAGYVCYKDGKQVCLNGLDDPVILGKSYFPERVLVINDEDKELIYDELFSLDPVKKLIAFFGDPVRDIFAYDKKAVCTTTSALLSFCQSVLELALIYEIANLKTTEVGDFILRDGTLRPIDVKQKYSVMLGEYLKKKGIIIVAITKNSGIKMELSYTFKQIDTYLQDKLKPTYSFKNQDSKCQKLCCWFEVPTTVLSSAYGQMYIKKELTGGRGFGLFFVARLDYVEKLQNYDWLVVDVNIFDAIPGIKTFDIKRDILFLESLFKELTRLTQEHYILGYPYPLVEVHNFITLKKTFKDEIIKRVKFALYGNQQMDNVDIENIFLDIHDRF
ncbi:MAG: DNA double-strand break repair nuclease NurA [Patescibacteria group bacterium]|nr:DNA double-strand break repair nuclease NurA [Patescibacteria group bacterium]